jgi:hypothetical protein
LERVLVGDCSSTYASRQHGRDLAEPDAGPSIEMRIFAAQDDERLLGLSAA